MNQTQMLNLVRQLNFDLTAFEEIQDKNSHLADFIASFTLNYIVTRLDPDKRQQFINLLSNPSDNHSIQQFIDLNISDFNKNFSADLEKKLKTIKNKVISNQN